jgi:adenylate kinase
VKAVGKALIIFIGPPGAGKGSLSQLCTQKLGWVQLSTGFLCRKHIADQTEIGKQIDFSIRSGKLVDDRLIVGMVREWLEENAEEYQGVILDGFPRNVSQAQALEDVLIATGGGFKLNVVRLTACDTTIIDRLATRFVCQNKDCQMVYSGAHEESRPKKINTCDACSSSLQRRADDEIATVQERLKTYHGHERPLIEFYAKSQKMICEINVERSLSDVFEDFKRIVSNLYDHH